MLQVISKIIVLRMQNGKWIHFQFMGHRHWPCIPLVTPPDLGNDLIAQGVGNVQLAFHGPGDTPQIWAMT